jgi:hypothetical protein
MLGTYYSEPTSNWDTWHRESNSVYYLPEERALQRTTADDEYISTYNDYYLGGVFPVPLSDGNLSVPPEYLSYDENGYPTDWHLSLTSPLIDMGDPSELDPDGSRSDMGPYGGPDGDKWDLDWDGYPNYFWPGTIHDAPLGFYEEDFDCDDRDPWVFLCP